jgi:hypothetical protein
MRTGMLLLLVAMTALSGCAGARPRILLDSARYPVSLSGVVPDRDGQPLGPKEHVPVGRFMAKKTGWAMVYTFLPLNTVDFSEELNRQVSAVDGDAVVNLVVSTLPTGCQKLNMFQFTQILPIFLGCVDVKLEGDIIRSRSSVASSARRKKPSD